MPSFTFGSKVKRLIRRLTVTEEKPFKEALFELLGIPEKTKMHRRVFTKAYNMWFEHKRTNRKSLPSSEQVESVVKPAQAIEREAELLEDLGP
jgi:hypothetical protein